MKKLSLVRVLNEIDERESEALNKALQSTVSSAVQSVIDWVSNLQDSDLSNYRLKNRIPIGNGNAGVVFDSCEPGKVVKLSTVSSDYDVSDFLDDELSHVTIPNEKFKVHIGDGTYIFATIMDKMNPLSDTANDMLSTLRDVWQSRHDKNYQSYDLKRSKKRYEILRDFYRKRRHELDRKQVKIIQAILRMMRKLHKKNIAFNDFKPEQFMFDQKGKLILVDLGSLRSLDK